MFLSKVTDFPSWIRFAGVLREKHLASDRFGHWYAKFALELRVADDNLLTYIYTGAFPFQHGSSIVVDYSYLFGQPRHVIHYLPLLMNPVLHTTDWEEKSPTAGLVIAAIAFARCLQAHPECLGCLGAFPLLFLRGN